MLNKEVNNCTQTTKLKTDHAIKTKYKLKKTLKIAHTQATTTTKFLKQNTHLTIN